MRYIQLDVQFASVVNWYLSKENFCSEQTEYLTIMYISCNALPDEVQHGNNKVHVLLTDYL